jgi:hypothetical protein
VVAGAGPGIAAGAAAAAAGLPDALVRDLDATGTFFGFVVRVPASGDGAITSMSGSTVWAGAFDGATHNPTAIANPTTEVRSPPRQISLFFIRSPYGAFSALSNSPKIVSKIS